MARLNRREFLWAAGVGGVFLSAEGTKLIPRVFGRSGRASLPLAQDRFDPRQPTNFTNPLLLPSDTGLLGVFQPSSNFTMSAKVIDQEILPGASARLWVYEVERAGKRYLNPIIRMRTGDDFSTTFKNDLSEVSIIHWHGFHVSGRNDGHPGDVIGSGATYPYNFPVLNRAATYWYHPHPDGNTARQVYFGLAGLFIVEDEEENHLKGALDLSFGETDVPLIIQDRRFNADGTLLYNPSLSEYFMGFLGNVILANLTVKPFLDVSTRVYRFRILNGSNTRNYRLAFLKGSERLPFYIIGNDGGLVDRPYQATEVLISPAERVDVLLDLRNLQQDDIVFLKSLGISATGHHMGGRGGPMQPPGSGGLGEDEEFYILKLNVSNRITYDKQIPTILSDIAPINPTGAGAPTRPFLLTGTRSGWFINGLQFSMDQVPVRVSKNTIEIWETSNDFISVPHPMHLHGFQFQVLERINSPSQIRNMAVDSRGLLPTDKGWKDTVLVWPGERVRVAIDFAHNFSGEQLYVFHCHILEHEDSGMMINYKVV
ncbi:MAG: multicopper oxidase family protein [Acidobacteria bacterium]|nr:multicopper oxidase family protein [Acidobacteriota bacterium]